MTEELKIPKEEAMTTHIAALKAITKAFDEKSDSIHKQCREKIDAAVKDRTEALAPLERERALSLAEADRIYFQTAEGADRRRSGKDDRRKGD